MKVILLQDVDKLGSEGDIVTVKDGYGRNFLFPKKLAIQATRGAVKAKEEEARQAGRKRSQMKVDAENLARELERTEVLLRARVGSENRIFGSITTQQIADELHNHGFTIDRRRIELKEDIRMVGVYTATAKLHPEVIGEFKVRVVPDSDEPAGAAGEEE